MFRFLGFCFSVYKDELSPANLAATPLVFFHEIRTIHQAGASLD